MGLANRGRLAQPNTPLSRVFCAFTGYSATLGRGGLALFCRLFFAPFLAIIAA